MEVLMEMSENNSTNIVRLMTQEDIPEVIELQKRAFPSIPPWTKEQLINHLLVFSEGQLVVIDDNAKILGSSSSLIIDWDDYAESAQWSAITGNGTFNTHNPLGKTLYGADISVAPDARRQGIGTLFYEYRKKMVKEKGLKRILTGGRIPGYAQVSLLMSPKEYIAEVLKGRRTDRNPSF